MIDLENYKPNYPPSTSSLDYLQLEFNPISQIGPMNRFKKNSDKTERVNKEIYTVTSMATTAKKNEEK